MRCRALDRKPRLAITLPDYLGPKLVIQRFLLQQLAAKCVYTALCYLSCDIAFGMQQQALLSLGLGIYQMMADSFGPPNLFHASFSELAIHLWCNLYFKIQGLGSPHDF